MAQQFVNPTPNLLLRNFIAFDFPCAAAGDAPQSYHAAPGDANYNLLPPGIEQTYGLLGNPGKEQGHPAMREASREAMDPASQDQVLDINDRIRITHTGRLSGSGVWLFNNSQFTSTVRMFALPTMAGGPAIPLATIGPVPLTAGGKLPNVWYAGPSADEMLFTAYAVVDPRAVGLQAENTYRLVVKWEFWNNQNGQRRRMFISGFDEEVSFEVTSL